MGNIENLKESANKEFVIENGILTRYLGHEQDVIIPDGTEIIDYDCFSMAPYTDNHSPSECVENIETVKIPEGVTEIRAGAFSFLKKLRSVSLPNSLKKIGGSVFMACESLEGVRLPDGLEELGNPVGGGNVFSDCKKLSEIEIPDSVKVIGSYIYENAKILCSEKIFKKLGVYDQNHLAEHFFETGEYNTNEANIRYYCKKNYKRLIKRFAKEGDSTNLDFVLSCCKPLIDELRELISLSNNTGNAECTLILTGLLNSLYGSEAIEKYEDDKMEKTLGLKEKTLDDYRLEFSLVKRNGKYKITSYKCEDAVVHVPSRIEDTPVESVGEEVFSATRISYKLDHREYLKTRLEKVYIEEGVKEIGSYAFNNCFSLKEIHIPESVTSIDYFGLISSHDCVIFGVKDSEAEKYAAKENLKFFEENK